MSVSRASILGALQQHCCRLFGDPDMEYIASPSSGDKRPSASGPSCTGIGPFFFPPLASSSSCRFTPFALLRLRRLSAAKQGFGETYPHNPKVVADMTALHHIHEAGILHNLGRRAKDQKPYTFMVGAARGAAFGPGPSKSGEDVFHFMYKRRAQLRAAQYISTSSSAGFPAPVCVRWAAAVAARTPRSRVATRCAV